MVVKAKRKRGQAGGQPLHRPPLPRQPNRIAENSSPPVTTPILPGVTTQLDDVLAGSALEQGREE